MASIFPLAFLVLLFIFLSLSLSTALLPPSSSPPRKPPNSSPNFTLHAPPPNHTLHAPPPPPSSPPPPPPPPPPIPRPSHKIQAPPPPPPTAIPSHIRQVSPPSKPQSPPATPPQASSNPDNHQMNNIIDAIIGSGDFGNWIDLLMAAGKNNSNSSSVRVRATIFVPDDVALPQSKNPNSEPYPNRIDFDPFLFSYHVVPKRLSFAQLRSYAVGTRLPTLLPGNSILVTNNSLSNFTVNDSPITHPDLYLNDAVSVQGIGETFDYKLFGTEDLKNRSVHPSPPPPPPPRLTLSPPHRMPETKPDFSFLPGEFSGGRRSSCSVFCCWISLVYSFGIVIKLLPA